MPERALTKEHLALLATVTTISRSNNTNGFELQNNGPNSVWLALDNSALCIVDKCRKIAAGASVFFEIPHEMAAYVRASTADQVTTAGCIITELVNK